MAKRIERLLSLHEVKRKIGVTSDVIDRACERLGIDIVERRPKSFTQTECDQIEEWLLKNQPARWYVAYQAEDGTRNIDVYDYDNEDGAKGQYSMRCRLRGRFAPPYLSISRERAERVAPAMLG